MKITTLPYRKALIDLLDGNITYQGKSIRVFEGFLMETVNKKKALLNGNIEAYIILMNQTSNEARSNKCNRTNSDSIQLQITTVWPANKGGSDIAEEISNVVLGLLFPTSVKNADLTLNDGLDLWRCDLIGNITLPYYDLQSSRVWTVQLILEAWISQS